MLILSNCLTDVLDEGCLKVANSLIKRLKKTDENLYIVSYDRKHELSDEHLELNKLLLNRSLKKVLKNRNDKVLYIPFPARTLATALRIFVLSLFCKKDLSVLMVQKADYNTIAKLLMKLSRCKIIALSKEARDFYSTIIDSSRVFYIKAGVDTTKFVPAEESFCAQLKEKYGFDKNRPVILHVGHLNKGRGIDKLKEINPDYQVVLVCSTLTKDEQDLALKAELRKLENIRIIEEYLPDIEQIYQLSDVYFFPTSEQGRCIDIPLSCMEAASCGTPVVTTRYGEMKELEGNCGFYYLDSADKNEIELLIKKALNEKESPRKAVLSYDYNNAVQSLKSLL